MIEMTKEKLKLVIRERNKQRRERNKQRLIRAYRRWSYKKAMQSLRAKGYFVTYERGAK